MNSPLEKAVAALEEITSPAPKRDWDLIERRARFNRAHKLMHACRKIEGALNAVMSEARGILADATVEYEIALEKRGICSRCAKEPCDCEESA